MSRVTAIHLRMNIDVGMPTNFLCCSDPFYAPDLTMNASKIIGELVQSLLEFVPKYRSSM